MKTTVITFNNYIKTLMVFSILLAAFSCQDLELETPKHLITGETVYADSNSIEAAFAGIYANLRNRTLLTGDARGLSSLLGNYADELDYFSAFGLPAEHFYANTLSPNLPIITELWNNSYQQIYTANAIMEGVENSEHFSPQEKESFVGEALFIRGLLHFYLLQLFGDIPYVTTTNYLVNQSVSRQSENEVTTLIINDLLQATQWLPQNDNTGQKLRPNSYAASALLSRVNLYAQNWEEAELYATEVIDNNGWESNIENVFLKTSPSTLWQFSPETNQRNTLEGQTFIVLSAPPPTFALSENVIEDFEVGDLRLLNWVGQVTDGVNSWYFPFKYKLGVSAPNSAEYSIIMRMAEQYLIRAEARAMLVDISGAQSDLNKIRERAGLSPTLAASQNDLLMAIMKERRVEFFMEHGHRFFDLKRTNQVNNVLSPIKPGWDNNDQFLPLPETELVNNPNLQPQNPGY